MKEFLEVLDKDIKRCDIALKENNYIEIVIAVEELVDKYKVSIEGIGIDIDRGRVWNYSKRDLENLRDRLVRYRNEHIAELMFNSVRYYLNTNIEISEIKKDEAQKIVNEIEIIHNEETNKEEKWEKLKQYLLWVSNEDLHIATKVISIINIIIQIEC